MNHGAEYRTSKIACCVVGCHNAYYNTDPNLKFYSFPGRWYEEERRNIWIASVRRVSDKNQQWKPKSYDKVCSAHFIDNIKSNNPQSPSFNPTIFPKEYKKASTSTADCKTKRYERSLKRSLVKESSESTPISLEETVNNAISSEPSTKDFCCQADLPEDIDNNFVFECHFTRDSSDVATQLNIPPVTNSVFKQVSHKCVGNSDNIECEGFHGYLSIKTDKDLNSFCGVTFDRFALLLSLLTLSHGNSKLSASNKLLIFLAKIKLGISNCALGVLFNIHYSTCSRVFLSILNELVEKTRRFVYWPERNAIDLSMLEAFKRNYPKCRVIIDCTEIKIQQPKKVDDRIYTYSNYKGTFTAKFLIGIAPNGFISFVSNCYGGRSSDAFITNDSGFLNLLEANDVILADKGFPGIKCKDDVLLVIPPFVHQGILTPEEVEETYTVASVRIHVERSIQRVKIHNILQAIPANLFPYIDDIIFICCVLCNLQPPIIKEHQDEDEN